MNIPIRSRLILRLTQVTAAALTVAAIACALTRPRPDLAQGVVLIQRGIGPPGIARALFPGSVKDRQMFKAYVRLTRASRRLKSGEYRLDRDSIRSIAEKMIAGDVIRYRVTIPEGEWADDIASSLESAGIGRRDRYLALIHDTAFVREIAGVDAPSLEGFLFPETYFFSKDCSEEDVLRAFVSRFRQSAEPVLNRASLPALETLTLASMVEREAAVDDERPVIAGVFRNRLNKRMPLESCVTVEYALGMKKKRLLDDDLEVESPYNTYRHMGLPPGPVANPGLASIRAAAGPAETEYLFFVARGDGRHEFSRTWVEHKKSKRRFAAARNGGG